ncbi:hypothetical protein Y032_0055g2603 [Ancylostoma ceylanicum]|uniref:Uncharacterized protein n=1 Tax=Ancylostoma ceylanicum TaxID=53326 RepID=A0A016U7H3_9BILA|nr:hypothetical protein Y032_0055g2603 [Ancylostoma ceylanicum]
MQTPSVANIATQPPRNPVAKLGERQIRLLLPRTGSPLHLSRGAAERRGCRVLAPPRRVDDAARQSAGVAIVSDVPCIH